MRTTSIPLSQKTLSPSRLTNPFTLLKTLGIRPSKRLSQNFLVDQNIIEKLIRVADVKKDEPLLEIGPGLGAITKALLDKGGELFAVEKDQALFSYLQTTFANNKNLHLFHADILNFPLEKTLPQKTKGVANIPFQITAPLLGRLLPLYPLISSLTFIVQKEVAKRLTASPKTKDYGALTVFTKLFSEVQYDFTISRRCFYPIPNVDSAAVTLVLKPPPTDPDSLLSLVRTAFNQRRKMLTTSLKQTFDQSKVNEALSKNHLNPKARPEELSPADFIKLRDSLR